MAGSQHPERLPSGALLTPEEIAQRCALSVKTIYRKINAGELAASRLGNRFRVAESDFAAWVERNRVRARSPGGARPRAANPGPTRAGSRSALRAIEREASA